ncbi:hypothetical protein E3P86_02521 [Wallemia ichthyophaga]|uniref:Antiviral helicase n=1 Tax=Wallemia ichthyophaga TaxID=245174 RepID=A0A4T0J1A1_WALIC|nr:hypothetical protein E3P86_02521 [Wallemia ichthyophaga]
MTEGRKQEDTPDASETKKISGEIIRTAEKHKPTGNDSISSTTNYEMTDPHRVINSAASYSDGDKEAIIQQLLSELGVASLPSSAQIKDDIQSSFLQPPKKLSSINYRTIPRQPNLRNLVQSDISAPSSKLSFQRAGLDGNIVGHTEVQIPITARENARTSTSIHRAPTDAASFVRGKSGNVPFAPGGLDVVKETVDMESRNKHGLDGESAGTSVDLSKGGLRTAPPGFGRGLRFEGDESNSLDAISGASELPQASTSKHTAVSTNKPNKVNIQSDKSFTDASIDELLPDSKPHIPTTAANSRRKAQLAKREWAHVVNANKGLTNFDELVPDMAIKYPFKLDNFQQNAVYYLEMGDSVFVAAHTSAGKTVVAEYAIALAAKHMTRTIYTSPIKALSNQKYRDFKTTFDPSTVGILTGDVQINPEGSCLIMTTEILRSMLYKGADLIRDVEFVVFDEVHYVNDAERGVVWEEVIIMLPEHINIILLSATVPNAKEFADWVGRTKRKNIYVISTPKRPVPLEHHLFASKEIHKIVDSSGRFLSSGHKDATDALRKKQDKEREAAGLPPVQKTGGGGRGGRGGGRTPSNMGATGAHRAINTYNKSQGANRGGGNSSSGGNQNHHLVQYLKKKELLPVVIFTFSKRKCEENASGLGGMDLLTAAEKSEVHITIERSISRLRGSDKQLPQIARMKDLLGRGLAVHHGGLLPIVKELKIVELLFGRGLVKVLFATETFAMGVNMPARSVAFSGIRKHDGKSFRDLLPGEYTQMSGRAGRRGLDATGVVIIMTNDSIPETTTLQQMILGVPGKLNSQFRLTFNLILNLLRVETLKVEDMIKRSFSENASQRLLPDQQKQVEETEQRLALLHKLDRETSLPDLDTLYNVSASLVDVNAYIVDYALGHPQGNKMIGTGRVVLVRDSHFKGNLAVLLRPPKFLPTGASKTSKYYWVVGLSDKDTRDGKKDMKADDITPRWPAPLQEDDGELVYDLVSIPSESISMITKFTMKDLDVSAIVDHHRKSALQGCADYLKELLPTLSNNATLTDRSLEIDWSKLRGLEFHEALSERERLMTKVRDLIPLTALPEFDSQYAHLHVESGLKNQVAYLRASISDQNLELLPDYENRINALKEMQYIDQNSTVQLKGRVACEINSAHELILTELILENTFAAYEPEEMVALLSCFLFHEKTEVEPVIPPKLEEGRDTIFAIADKVQRVLERNKVESEDFETSLKFGLVEVVYEWAKGMPFEQITQLTDVPEGTIVRVITRLDQTCLEVRDAARVIGDAALFQKMEACQTMIKRDIIFAASLYV